MKRTVLIVTVVLVTVVASGCCGGLQNFLQHPLGPNTICEPVHRAHYDNGFEVGYGSECADCGLGAAPVCSCRQYGSSATAGCLKCAFSSDTSGPTQTVEMARPTKASRMVKVDRSVKRVSYTTGCTDSVGGGCTDCVESDPCCGSCGEVCCHCCTPRCPEPCVECVGPLSWLFTALHPEKYYGGCGEVYLGDFHSYPPDCTDPCNRCGRWTGESNCNAWTGCNVCGQCDAAFDEPCTSCSSSYRSPISTSCSSCGGEPNVIEGPSALEGPVLISQTDRVVRPGEYRTARTQNARAKRSTYSSKRR